MVSKDCRASRPWTPQRVNQGSIKENWTTDEKQYKALIFQKNTKRGYYQKLTNHDHDYMVNRKSIVRIIRLDQLSAPAILQLMNWPNTSSICPKNTQGLWQLRKQLWVFRRAMKTLSSGKRAELWRSITGYQHNNRRSSKPNTSWSLSVY